MLTIRDLMTRGAQIDFDDLEKTPKRQIAYYGTGWYSMDNDYIYRKGVFPTYSRINVIKDENRFRDLKN